jgi:aryl-alcohol dehydrogenase-like predicted oxidoreductase
VIQQRTPAGTDLNVSRVVLGTMTFGSQVDEADAAVMVERCRAAGVTMFDTSNNYNGGRSEEILGRAVRPFRDEVLISTKVGSPVGQADRAVTGLRRDAILRAADDSLRRLGTDRIDVYYLHRPDYGTPVSETLEALDTLVRAGKVRYAAQSNFAAWQITELLYLARQHDWPELLVSQPQYNLLSRRVEAEYAACSDHLGLFNIAYNPLAGGLLTGKHRHQDAPAPGTRFDRAIYRDRYWQPALFAAVDRLRKVAADAGLSLIELSFRWLLGRPLTGALLLGASSVAQLDANLAAVDDTPLEGPTLAACDDVWADLAGAAPDYNR